MWRALALLAALWPHWAGAQEMTPLPELRARIEGLYGEVERLRLVLDGSAQNRDRRGFSGSPLQRLAAIESELRRLTGKTEELEYRVDRMVRDGTARIGDLDYRLCTLEPGCNPRQLARPQPLGGADAAPVGPVPLAGAEQSAAPLLEGARAALEAGDFAAAAQGFADHLAANPGGLRTAEAELLRGRAKLHLADQQGAARAFLAAFSAQRDGPLAAESLTELGRVMGEMGQIIEACATLSEVAQRFPASPYVADAAAARGQFSCP